MLKHQENLMHLALSKCWTWGTTGQAKKIATEASNRHPDNAIFNIIVRLQAKQILGDFTTTLQKRESLVNQAADALPPFEGTAISKELVKSNLSTWQSHLKRISHFLRCKGIWWHEDSDNYVFHVSDADPDYHKNPTLLHFWSNQVTDVFKRSQQCWQEVIDEEVALQNVICFSSLSQLQVCFRVLS